MKFEYQPETGEFAIYATPEEFQLASRPVVENDTDPHRYRVIGKTLRRKDGSNDPQAIYAFVNEYVSFIKRIFADLHPDEKIKDIVIFSTMAKMGYMWTSLFDMGSTDNSYNFMEMILSYALGTIEGSGDDVHGDSYKNLMELMTERDFAKLTLAKVLLTTMENPNVWKVKKKSDDAAKKMLARAALLTKKIVRFEKKYGFASTEMEHYYADDKLPDKDMRSWMTAWEEIKIIELTKNKYALAEDLVTQWAGSF